MADIELVIKIPKQVYNYIRKYEHIANSDALDIKDAIINGIPLPKGHGRLVDLDQMCEEYWDGNYMEIHSDDLDSIKTIIEADTESEE